MPLDPGAKLGPYEVVGPLGAGGMGEVYRARDQRLGRDVAVKVLPQSFAGEPERLMRFEQEARAAGQLNHPNILVVYDIGTHEGAPYVVEELLEGETLRQRLSGAALPTRKAIEYAGQITQGLAAAHQKGIVHRDLKPENLFVTHDGRVKILDFGLAKLQHAPPLPASQMTAAPTAIETGAGVVMGTVGYMSPEQVRGLPADHRSDIFSFGCVLYEMISGRRAFQRDSSVETMNAILKEDPPEISQTRVDLPPGLDRIVQHCLEKSPDERFQSARDLAFQIHALSSPPAVTSGRSRIANAPRALKIKPLLAAAGVVVALAAGILAGRMTVKPPASIRYQQITFRQGTVYSGRFSPDGETIIYSAEWDGNPREIFTARYGTPESRTLGLPPADVLSVSSSGELAVLLNARFTTGYQRKGTLARVPLAGGVPREVLENVQDADWPPGGSDPAAVREVDGRYRLEYPIGKVLYETPAWIDSARFSRDGRRIAFSDHPVPGDTRGRIVMVDLAGKKTVLTEEFASASGLAWSQDGSEIWFTAGEKGNLQSLYAVDLSGHRRLIAAVPADLTLSDVAAQGRILIVRGSWRRGILGLPPGATVERDLSWLDYSRPAALSNDGRVLFFDEQGEGAGPNYTVYLRKTDGSAAVKLSDGAALGLSRDGRWAATAPTFLSDTIRFVPTGAGEPRTARLEGCLLRRAEWHPDGHRLVILASQQDHLPRLYVIDMDGGTPRPITEEEPRVWGVISPDGRSIAVVSRSKPGRIIPFEGGEARPLPGLLSSDALMRWSDDGKSVFVIPNGVTPYRIERIDVATGARSLVREIHPADRAGLVDLGWFCVSGDGRSYVYSYRRNLGALYVGTQGS
jgi:hypothetical protein